MPLLALPVPDENGIYSFRQIQLIAREFQFGNHPIPGGTAIEALQDWNHAGVVCEIAERYLPPHWLDSFYGEDGHIKKRQKQLKRLEKNDCWMEYPFAQFPEIHKNLYLPNEKHKKILKELRKRKVIQLRVRPSSNGNEVWWVRLVPQTLVDLLHSK